MTREEMLACLTDRPCDVCKFHTEKGCKKWSCVFEEEPDDAENKDKWIPFSKELPPKGEKVHVSTFGIVTIGERTSEADETLRLSILEPMNNLYKNIDPKQYQITHWQSLPKGHER